MGLIWRRRVRIAPGLALNLSKSGPSVTLGAGALHVTYGRRRRTTSVRIAPGLWWRSTNRRQP